jgi:uncharacterized protein
MTARLLGDTGGQRTYAVVFDTGDEPVSGLLAFAREHGVAAASLSGVGAFRSVTLGYFELHRRDYRKIQIDEQVEVLSLVGNVAIGPDGGPKIHAHVVVGKADGTAHGGHLLDGRVRPTLEVMVIESPAALRRRTDPATGLALLDVAAAQ